jgi:hypothetical protein
VDERGRPTEPTKFAAGAYFDSGGKTPRSGQLLKDAFQVPDAGGPVPLLGRRLLAWFLFCPLLLGVLSCPLLAERIPQGGGQVVAVTPPHPDSQPGVRNGIEDDLE